MLCLDEVGYAFPSKDQADAIFQVIAKRAETKTTIMTTNLVPSQWNKVFDATTATAILDRLWGESKALAEMRCRDAPESGRVASMGCLPVWVVNKKSSVY